MTTLVTVKANGPCYPARLVVRDAQGNETKNELVASGYSVEQYVGTGTTVTVTEEYHPEGFAYPT